MCIIDRSGRLHRVVVLDDPEERIDAVRAEIREAIVGALGEG
jgi:hypothetical protein